MVFKPKHGLHGIPEYWVWQGIKRRCRGDEAAQYYADLGVTLYPEWEESFKAFYDYVGPRPGKDYSIDRYPNPAGNYEPGNVRWATASEQRKNQRRGGCLITLNGRTQHASEWAVELGLTRATIAKRLRRGWSPQDALLPNGTDKFRCKLTPVDIRIIRDIEGQSLTQIAKRFGVCAQTIHGIRRRRAWKSVS